jgi:hypothetical protein
VSTAEIESMREALAALLRTPSLMQGFGVERRTVCSDLWSERLAIRGTGQATLATLRSFGDASGEEIGRYETKLSDRALAELVHAVEATVEGGPPATLLSGDLRLLISVVACGSRLHQVVGGDPTALEPYAPLLRALDAAAFETRTAPKSTLQLGLEIPANLPDGPRSLGVVLSFQNRGNEGAWIRNPASHMKDEPTEHVRLWYAQRPVAEPGMMPPPLKQYCVALDPIVRVERPLLWLGGGETESRQFSAAVDLLPGSYLMRASYASYDGEDTVAAQPLLRGCVFSAEIPVEVGE